LREYVVEVHAFFAFVYLGAERSTAELWMRSSRVVRASDNNEPILPIVWTYCSTNMQPKPKSQMSWFRSQHPLTQWNLRGAD
jgi:hypothetical protein